MPWYFSGFLRTCPAWCSMFPDCGNRQGMPLLKQLSLRKTTSNTVSFDLMYNTLSHSYKTTVLSAGLNNAITLYKESIYLRTTYFDDISLHLGIESLTP